MFSNKELKGMPEKPIKQAQKRKKNTETAYEIASKFGVTPRYVRMVLNGERDNQAILDAAIIYEEGKNELLEKVKELVPFERKKAI